MRKRIEQKFQFHKGTIKPIKTEVGEGNDKISIP